MKDIIVYLLLINFIFILFSVVTKKSDSEDHVESEVSVDQHMQHLEAPEENGKIYSSTETSSIDAI